jgi:RNA recognition motif-containing protein
LVFKSESLSYDAQRKFNGQILEGRELIFEIKGPYKRKKKLIKKKTSILSRLGPGPISSRLGPKSDIFSRLAPKLEDRLGKKLEDRLGDKRGNGKKSTPVKNLRNIRSYADAQVAEMDGQLI